MRKVKCKCKCDAMQCNANTNAMQVKINVPDLRIESRFCQGGRRAMSVGRIGAHVCALAQDRAMDVLMRRWSGRRLEIALQ